MNFQPLLQLLRPKDWIKNGLVLMPLIFSGLFLEVNALLLALYSTLLFCLAASSAYIVNDLHDIEQDRHHPVKSKTRPLAKGSISIKQAIALLGLLYLLLMLAGFALPTVMFAIGLYLILNMLYTFALKQQPVIDLFCIALGFVLRLYAGGLAINVPVSGWMLITTFSLALYFASTKRQQELRQHCSHIRPVLEKYSPRLIGYCVHVSAISALLFYGMFVMFNRPELMLTIPLTLFGLFRYAYLVEYEQTGESPTDALLGDWQLAMTLIIWLGYCIYSCSGATT